MLKKKKNLIMIIVFIMSVLLSGCEKESEVELKEITMEELDEKGASEEESEISKETVFVHVCGEVKKPGVYELLEGSRVYEAIDAAGGMTSDAAKDALNQAELLSDGQQIIVRSREDVLAENQNLSTEGDGKININQASKEQLMTLSGIGESKADAIIRYRNDNGNFRTIEEIMEIEGIKEGVFKKIEDLITVS